MSRPEPREIMPGTVLEFYESREILCGVVMAVKDGRFHVLTERNREVNLTPSRVLHQAEQRLDINASRDELAKKLAEFSRLREELTREIDLEEIWLLLVTDAGGFSPAEIAEFVFSTPVPDNQAAAVSRVLLQDRLYFQAKDSQYYPRSEEAVEQRRAELEREAERERRLCEGARWLEAVWNRKTAPALAFRDELIGSIKDFAIFGQQSAENAFVKEILKRAGVLPQQQSAFRILVRLGVWKEDENLLLYEHGISADFTPEAAERAEQIARAGIADAARTGREDLTSLDAFTVDSEFTRDYDDALSIRELDGGIVEAGVHIADAAEFIARGDLLDVEAAQRASSIYLPDDRICMLPPSLSEGILSLKAGEDRLAVSFLIRMDREGNILDTRIVPSVVRIRDQLTYQQVDERIERDAGLQALHDLALKRRRGRVERGAIILPLPEMHVYVNDAGMIQVTRYDKETPSQLLVSEWMIEANTAAAEFLAERNMAAIFRAQAECRPETEFVQSEHELFRIYRQRRLFSRAELTSAPKPHCSLAIARYTTVTSPIRRYADLVVQRQLKQAIGDGSALYTGEELDQLLTGLAAAQSRVFAIQRKWTRYWLLKYIEQEDLETLNALVLDKNSRFAHLLLPDLFMEANAPVPEKAKFQAGEMVRIRIDKVVPREDTLKIQILETPPK